MKVYEHFVNKFVKICIVVLSLLVVTAGMAVADNRCNPDTIKQGYICVLAKGAEFVNEQCQRQCDTDFTCRNACTTTYTNTLNGFCETHISSGDARTYYCLTDNSIASWNYGCRGNINVQNSHICKQANTKYTCKAGEIVSSKKLMLSPPTTINELTCKKY